ncbi:TolC family protein [Thermogemmata fonticola]|uniref:TolC family protein n=1 Tax=Thermogemmata fonticola TaxID=2755323 RepID=A0A7V9ADE6_9BACT|nr:TolC family protein [Thermogemmata fonticola]MBA2227752.1 TolC family protein [Thermogemmata fonticola]
MPGDAEVPSPALARRRGECMLKSRWIRGALAGWVAASGLSGCRQPIFLEPGDYKDAVLQQLPPALEDRPHDPITPSVVQRIGNGPATVLDPERPPRYITLKECIALALEQGNTGIQSATNPGLKNDTLGQFTGRGVVGSDAVRVFAIDPAIAAAELERSLSKFDARWVTAMTWQKVDQPVAAQFIAFQQQRDAASFSSSLIKPLPTGGVAGITFSTDYSKFAALPQAFFGGFVNPNYTPRLQFTVEQPLLRLFGVEVNQLSPSHPGSVLLNLPPSGGAGTEGILISRIRLDQQRTDFDVKINYLLLNVEAAYWNLYAAYYNLYAQEEGLRQAYEGYRFIRLRVLAGNEPPQSEYQARAQFERFRGDVVEARGQVLEAERQLRGLLGLRSDDGFRLVPIDKPNEAPYVPDFYEAANEALAHRPELLQLRQDLKAQQLNLLLQKNLRRPDLRVFAQYDIAGLGTRLDGREFADPANTIPGNALASFGNNQFNSWTIGLRLDMPLGLRDANASVREAQLNLARSYFALRDAEMKALEYLLAQYRRVIQAHTVIGYRRAEREYLQMYLGKVAEVIAIGTWNQAFYQNYLTVQQQLAQAIAREHRAIADYNTALAAFEYAKGTIQRYNNVSVLEGPPPPWVQKKAADYIRERTEAAIKLRERDLAPPPAGAAGIGGQPVGPAVGTPLLSELPPFAQPRPPLPEDVPLPRPGEPPGVPPVVPPGSTGRSAPGPNSSSGAPGRTPGSESSRTPGGSPPGTWPPAGSSGGGSDTPPPPTAAEPAPGDYFRPSGRVILPRRERRLPAVPSCPPPSRSSDSGLPRLSLPVPPPDIVLPTPPPETGIGNTPPSLPPLPALPAITPPPTSPPVP